MPADRLPPDAPQEWLNRARSNLVRAAMKAPGVYLEDLCFDAQQAAEKAIKAVLIERGIAFPYIHDLARLLRLLAEAGESIAEDVWEADRLTRFASVSRYPSVEAITEEEHAEAIAVAQFVVRWAERRLEPRT